jgi:hypothetical protein
MPMSIRKTRKDKEHPHYNFLYTWAPVEAHVKRESQPNNNESFSKLSASKKAEIQAKEDSIGRIKKDIVKSLILVSFIIILELGLYLAWSKFILS